MKEKIKRFYTLGLYTEKELTVFVEKGILTRDEYKEITGKDF